MVDKLPRGLGNTRTRSTSESCGNVNGSRSLEHLGKEVTNSQKSPQNFLFAKFLCDKLGLSTVNNDVMALDVVSRMKVVFGGLRLFPLVKSH